MLLLDEMNRRDPPAPEVKPPRTRVKPKQDSPGLLARDEFLPGTKGIGRYRVGIEDRSEDRCHDYSLPILASGSRKEEAMRRIVVCALGLIMLVLG